jgi:UDP:flavonoid glycosyltransferase YjiC (YdhE family)
MASNGHFRRMQPLIACAREIGLRPVVFTDRAFLPAVRTNGGEFADLFAEGTPHDADGLSRPRPCRYVSFAARYAEGVIARARELAPALVITDSFAVIGRVVATELGLPYVNVCSGHNAHPDVYIPHAHEIYTIEPSEACEQAVRRLRGEFGITDASPLSWLGPLSPHLNVYCEPPEFLTEPERESFAPVVFFGSLPWGYERDEPPAAGRTYPDAAAPRRIYASFGTIVWPYFPLEAAAAMRSLSAAAAIMPDTQVVIGLGGHPVEERVVAELRRPNVLVQANADQWAALAHSDAAITHQGLNSTHEAIWHRVPMLSYPFFGDQPSMTDLCRRLAVARPLTESPLQEPAPEQVRDALLDVLGRREEFHVALERVRAWETAVMAERVSAMGRIAALI